jgi:hypothetical protein
MFLAGQGGKGRSLILPPSFSPWPATSEDRPGSGTQSAVRLVEGPRSGIFEAGSAPRFLNVEVMRLPTWRRGVACDARK